MKPARAVPRFRCDYRKRVATKAAMIRHERRCFRNPNRVCDKCNNTGTVREIDFDKTPYDALFDGDETATVYKESPCPYCERYRRFLEQENAKDAHADWIATGGY